MKTQRILKYENIESGPGHKKYEVNEKPRQRTDGTTGNPQAKKPDLVNQDSIDSIEDQSFIPNATQLDETIAQTEKLLQENRTYLEVSL